MSSADARPSSFSKASLTLVMRWSSVSSAIAMGDRFDWGYASLAANGDVTPEDEDAVNRARLDCPAHAITVLTEAWLQ
jgi:hypothetical protein